MADLLKKISELNALVNANPSTDYIAIVSGGTTYKITIDNFLRDINLSKFTETEFDNGNVSSGTFTPNCDTNGNAHQVTLTGAGVTIGVPTKTLVCDEMIESAITIIGGDTNVIAGWGAGWDFGPTGEPTLTTKSIIGFKRRAGDTKTYAWHRGGYT